MTPPQQPQEHCGHECVCNGIQVASNFKCPVDSGYWKSCKHDTRSHPAPATPVTCPHYELRDGAYYCGCEYDKMHDDIIAAKAREDVLEELDNLRKYAHVEFEEANTSDNEREMRIHLEYENRIWDLMKQLRQSQQGGDRR